MTSTFSSDALESPSAAERIAIVEDHELLADSLAFALSGGGFEPVVIRPTSEREVLHRVFELAPRVVLLDVHLGEMGSGLELIEPLRALKVDVICVTGEASRAVWGACIESGAAGIVSKAVPFDELVERISAVLAGEAAISATEREALLYAVRKHRNDERVRLEPFQRLTVRECEVLHELMEGLPAETIAERAYVSLTTVRSHIRAILQKLGVTSQLAAVTMAVRANWSSPHRRPN
jgi:DNA-binding NarL/FixJ family response regulator